MKSLKLVNQKRKERPAKHSPVALAFEIEIKRIAIEKGLAIGKVIEILSEKTGVCQRHIYHYRSGKTDIPSLLIPTFCKQFGSNALAMAVVSMCNETEFDERDNFDLARFAGNTVRSFLQSGDEFLAAFDDGVIDSYELSNLSNSTARIICNANRLLEIATVEHQRRRAA